MLPRNQIRSDLNLAGRPVAEVLADGMLAKFFESKVRTDGSKFGWFRKKKVCLLWIGLPIVLRIDPVALAARQAVVSRATTRTPNVICSPR
jgi:hypothetical protein